MGEGMSFDVMAVDEGLERPDHPQAENGRDEPSRARTDRVGRLFRIGVILLCAAFWLGVVFLIF